MRAPTECGRGMPAGCWLRRGRLSWGWRTVLWCGRRWERCRWRWMGCMSGWRRAGTATGRRSGGCGRRGGAEAGGSAGSFGVHPALLDAALHASALAGVQDPGAEAGEVRLPFAWTGVSVHAAGASVLRVRLRQSTAGEFSLVAADGAGTLAVSVESLVSRPVPAGQLEAAAGGLKEALFTVEWGSVPADELPADELPAGGVPAGGVPAADRWAVIGAGGPRLAAGLAGA